jgi:hypothetical protein
MMFKNQVMPKELYNFMEKMVDDEIKNGLKENNFWCNLWIDEYGFSHPRTATTYSSACRLIDDGCFYHSDPNPIREAYKALTMTIKKERNNNMPKIKEVIFNNPATIIYWRDGTKTVVKCQPEDTYDKEKGFMAAYMKKICGNDNTFNKIINNWCNDSENNKSKNYKDVNLNK